jgi:hypothetical protein
MKSGPPFVHFPLVRHRLGPKAESRKDQVISYYFLSKLQARIRVRGSIWCLSNQRRVPIAVPHCCANCFTFSATTYQANMSPLILLDPRYASMHGNTSWLVCTSCRHHLACSLKVYKHPSLSLSRGSDSNIDHVTVRTEGPVALKHSLHL